MSRQGRGTEERKEEEAPLRPADNADITKKVEYNRWLVRQENVRMASEVREQQKEGQEFVKERQRLHATQGLSRQQAAMVQMKKASEALEAHRQGNLSRGRQVYEEVSGWRVQEKKEKEDWQAAGKLQVKQVKEEEKVKVALEAAAAERKAKAAVTRKEGELKAKELEELREVMSKEVQDKTAKVKAETADSVTDDAKRFFYEQRLEKAREIKREGEAWAKQRDEQRNQFQDEQNKRRSKAKTARVSAGKSREALKTQRASEAAKLREVKQQLAEVHKQNLQMTYAERSAAVKQMIASGYVQSDTESGAPASPIATGGKPPATPPSARPTERGSPSTAART